MGGILDFLTGKKRSEAVQNQQSVTRQVQQNDRQVLGKDVQRGVQQRGAVTGTEQLQQQQRQIQQRSLSQPITAALEQQLLSLIGPQAGILPGAPGNVPNPSAQIQQADVTQTLANRALGADQTSADAIAAIVEASRAAGERTLTRATTTAAQQAGSAFNSFVQELGSRGAADLETQLAGLQGQLGLQARQAGTQELLGAIEAFGRTAETDTRQVASLVDALKGAVTSAVEVGDASQVARTEEQQTINTLQEILRALQESANTESVTTVDAQGSTTTRQPSTILDFLNVFSQFPDR